MAKNANAKAWSLQLGELSKRWSDQPFDLTGPSAPTIAIFGSPTQTTVGVQVTVAAVDNRTGVIAYQVETSTVGASGPFTIQGLVSVAQATAGFDITGLQPSNTYWIRLKGKDGSFAGNIGAASNVISQTTSAPAPSVWYPNWPIANIATMQGNVTGNLLDSSQHAILRDFDIVMFQGFNPTASRCANRVTNIDLVQAPQKAIPGGRLTRFTIYMSQQQATKVAGDGNPTVNFNLINHATKGNPNWWLRRVTSGAQIEAPWDPINWWLINIARCGLVNSLGQTYHVALAKEWKALLNASDDAHNVLARIVGVFYDDTHFRMQTPMTVSNGTVTVTDPDFEQNGVIDVIDKFGPAADAGSRKWSEGHIDHRLALKAEHGPDFLWMSNSSRVSTDYFDSELDPPLPFSAHPAYKQIEMGLHEAVNNAGFGITKTTSAYSYNGGGSLHHASRMVHIHRLMLMDDNQCAGGKAWVLVHANTINRTQTQDDYAFARMVAAFSLIQEKCAPSVCRGGTIALPLDELLLELGNPIGTRSLGTMNEATNTYTQRSANFSNGVGRFFWHEFEKGIVIFRGDNPPLAAWPNTGAALSCTLPNPGSGKKWQRINAASYTNPITGLSMRNQSPTINSGADTGATISLRPFEGIFLRRVDV